LKKVTIYTDGACSGNPGPGGWAAILKYGEIEKELSGFEADTTNNRMELSGVIQALTVLKEPCDIEIFTDSRYVCDAVNNRWVHRWRANGWKRAKNAPALNSDLWEQLLQLLEIHKTTFTWVKGHSDNPYNSRCDALAVGEYAKRKAE